MSAEDLRDACNRIRGKAASVNQNAARAVQEAAGLRTYRGGTDIWHVHDPLQATFREAHRGLTAIEQELARLDVDHGQDLPRDILDEHAARLKEQYDGPVLNIALMLLEQNRVEWLYLSPETQGADAVRRHGLTANQRSWLNDLQDAWAAYDGGDR